MRTRIATVVAASGAALLLAAPAFPSARTTNPSQMVQVKVTITESAVTLKPTAVERGSNVVFLITNQAPKPVTFQLGEAHRLHGSSGFARTLGANSQQRVVVFMDFRGVFPVNAQAAGKKAVKSLFRIT